MVDIIKVESELKRKEQKIAVSFFLCILFFASAIVPFCLLPEKVAIFSSIIFGLVVVI